MNDRKAMRPDFELTNMISNRAHELEPNKFAHALEVERLKILQLVNGGAFTVLVVFAIGLIRTTPGPAGWRSPPRSAGSRAFALRPGQPSGSWSNRAGSTSPIAFGATPPNGAS